MQSRVIPLRVSPVTFHGLMDVDKQLDVGREPHVVLAYLPNAGLQESLNTGTYGIIIATGSIQVG